MMASESDLPLVLPPNITPSQFKTYLDRARDIVSASNVTVITSDTHPDLTGPNSYLSPAKAHDMYHILSKTHFLAVRILSCLTASVSIPSACLESLKTIAGGSIITFEALLLQNMPSYSP